MSYLPIPETNSPATIKDFMKLLPPKSTLSDWQKIMYEKMVWQYMNQQEGYKWNESSGDGCVASHYHPKTGERLLNSKKFTYCCGVSLELWWLSLVEYLNNENLNELLPTYSDFKRMRAWWYCYDSKYWTGGAGGVVIPLQNALTTPQKQSQKIFPLEFQYHTDLYQAEFGALLQLQPNENPMSGGHSCVFIGLEKRIWDTNGKVYDCFRVFESNSNSGYGFSKGVKINWYWMEKINQSGFQRVVHVGQLI